jgi:hypothetical protein
MELYELLINDETLDGIEAISLVRNPAIEVNGVYFNEHQTLKFAQVENEERILMSPILIPEKMIIRQDAGGNVYYVYFSEKTVKRLSQMYLEKKRTDQATLEHEKPIDGVYLVESWIVESVEKDKSRLYGFNVPKGTWMGSFRISSNEIWEDYVKTGEVKGVSVEAFMEHKLTTPTKKNHFSSELTPKEADLLLEQIKSLVFQYFETNPQVSSSYPGESAESGSIISPALQ